jgi:hypothetical protein
MQVAHDKGNQRGENAPATMRVRGLFALLSLSLGLLACEGQEGLDSDVELVARNVLLPPGMSTCGIWPLAWSQFRIYSDYNQTGQCLRGQIGTWVSPFPFIEGYNYTWPNGVTLAGTIRSYALGSPSSTGCHFFRVYRNFGWTPSSDPPSPLGGDVPACYSGPQIRIANASWEINSFRSDSQ